MINRKKKYYLGVSYRFNEPKGPIYGDTLIAADEDTNLSRLRHKIAEDAISKGYMPTVFPTIISISELSKGLYKALARKVGELETPKERM